MTKEFEMKNFGRMQYFLRMEVYRSEDAILISQTKYAKDMLKNLIWLIINQPPLQVLMEFCCVEVMVLK